MIAGASPPASSHHLAFTVLESLKVLGLLALPFTLPAARLASDP